MDETELNYQRGQQAKQLLESELLNEMFRKIEEDCQREIRASSLLETEVREKAYLLLKTVDVLKTKLRAVYDTGVMAEVAIRRRGRPPKQV